LKILLVAVDKDITSVMKKAELNFVSTSSATSAKIMLADGGVEVVIIDDEIKGAEAFERFIKKKAEVLVIGRELSRPLEIEELKAKLKVIEEPADKKIVKKESEKKIVNEVKEIKEKPKKKKKIESVKKIITEKMTKENEKFTDEELENLQRKVNINHMKREKVEKKRQQKKTKHYILPTMVISFWGSKRRGGENIYTREFCLCLKGCKRLYYRFEFCRWRK